MFAASKTKQVAAAGTSDPFFPYVPLLLETTSTNGQQNNTFLDSSTNNFTITRNGTPTQGSITPYWPNGYWGKYNTVKTDSLSATSVAAITTFTGDFTIECWVYPTDTTLSTVWGIIDARTSSSASPWTWGLTSYSAGWILQFYTGTQYNFTTRIQANTWTHVVLQRNGTTLRSFVNGVVDGTTGTISGTITGGSSTVTLGNTKDSGLAGYGNVGYISNLRIVNGTAVYTTTGFTPPTTPLTAITNTSLLTFQSNRFLDNSTNNFTITPSGTPRVQAFQPFSPVASYTTALYGGSGYFNGSTDYVSAASNAAFGYGTADFTIEFWIYPTTISASTPNLIDQRNGAASSTAPTLYLNNGVLTYYTNGANIITGSSLVANSWYHIALVKSSGSTKLYLNGAQVGSTYSDSNNYITSPVRVFASNDGSTVNYQAGYCSNLRIVKGTAVYTGAFTPPTLAPLTTAGSTSAASYSSTTNVNTSFASSATSLLTNYTNAGIYDAAVQNNAITAGSAQSSTTVAKWSPTSMKFNGTTDYLQILNSITFDFGTTADFTIEGWIYPTTLTPGGGGLSNSNVIAGCLPASGTLNGWTFQFNSSGYIQLDTFVSGTEQLITATSNAISINTWTYVAVTRAGSTYKLFVNGTQATTTGTITQAVNSNGNPLKIGAGLYTTYYNYFTGYIQDLRLTKGYARTITTPTAAFPTR